MTKKISNAKPVINFIEAAKEYCLLVEKRDDKTNIQLLQQVFIVLPQLCLCGMRLPDVKRLSDYEPARLPYERRNDLSKSLQVMLKDYDVYTEIFDPYDVKEQEPIRGVLSDDLSDIYLDLRPGLHEWEQASPREKLDIIWDWKFGFEHHWGRHATSAFRALYSLLYNHIEGKYELYIGIREEG
jgi:hypothetical protein